MKRFGLFSFIVGFIFTVCGFVFSCIGKNFPSQNIAFDVLFDSYLPNLLKIFGIITLFWAVIFLLFGKHIGDRCGVLSLAVSLIASVAAGFGSYCLLGIAVSRMISDPAKTPVQDVVFSCVTIFCLIVGIIAVTYYVFYRSKSPSFMGVFIDVAFGLSYIIPFFLSFGYIYGAAESIVRYLFPNF